MSDGGDDHRRLRGVIGRPLTPKLRQAATAGWRACGGARRPYCPAGAFDAVPDLAEVLPTTRVPDRLDGPRVERSSWVGQRQPSTGSDRPTSERPQRPREYSRWPHLPISSPPASYRRGRWPPALSKPLLGGELTAAQCPMAIIDYLGPLDTTVSGLGNAIWLFATHPEQWQCLREDPGRAKQAFDEAIRRQSPVTGFTRVTTWAVEIGGVGLPAGARVLVSYAVKRIATSATGTTLSVSILSGPTPRTSPSASASTPAPAWGWQDWKPPPC